MFGYNLRYKTAPNHLRKERTPKGTANEHSIAIAADPVLKVLTRVDLEFVYLHIGKMLRSQFFNIIFVWQLYLFVFGKDQEGFVGTQFREQVGKLLNGKDGRIAAIIGQYIAGREIKLLGHYYNRAFRGMQCIFHILAWIIAYEVLIKFFTADNEQVSKTGFPFEFGKGKVVKIFVDPAGNVVLPAQLLKTLNILLDNITVFGLQQRHKGRPGHGAGVAPQIGITDLGNKRTDQQNRLQLIQASGKCKGTF